MLHEIKNYLAIVAYWELKLHTLMKGKRKKEKKRKKYFQ